MRAAGCLLLAILFGMSVTTGSASAAGLASTSFGVNFTPVTENGGAPGDLSTASAAGVDMARAEINQGTDADPMVASLARLHLRLYPVLGLRTQLPSPGAAAAMAQYVSAFAQRYGSNGTFWSQNRDLPYEPVTSFEIGNEPNMPLQWIADETHLHWPDPSAYAAVYAAARSALHRVDPAGLAVVGGLADTGGDGVDVASDERWLDALTPGQVDAVGYHLYLAPSSLETDTQAFREWMDTNGFSAVPIDINEIGACDLTPQTTINTSCPVPSISSANWGTVTASFMRWALCTPALGVESYQAEYWGDLSTTDSNAILALVDSQGQLTPFGTAYLNETKALTTHGCPPTDVSPPTIEGSPVSGQTLTASAGSWSPAPLPTLTYQWARCDSSGGNCQNIGGADSISYQAQAADVGATLVVSVTATNPAGRTTAASLPTPLVSAETDGSGSSRGSSAPSEPSLSLPAVVGSETTPTHLALGLTRLRVSAVKMDRRTLALTARVAPATAVIVAVATRGRRRVTLHPTSPARHAAAVSDESAAVRIVGHLPPGRWTITISCLPPPGYAAPRAVRRRVMTR